MLKDACEQIDSVEAFRAGRIVLCEFPMIRSDPVPVTQYPITILTMRQIDFVFVRQETLNR